jgi:hypothetical protein
MVFGMNDEKKPPCPKGCGTMRMLFRTVMIAGDEIKSGNVGWDSRKGYYQAHGDYFDPMLGAHVQSKSHKRRILAEKGLSEVGNDKTYHTNPDKKPEPWKISPEVRKKVQQTMKLGKKSR